MKRIIFFLMIMPFAVQAQKVIKPSIPKAEAALREGKFDEAKEIIDVTVADEKFMVDKKGNPSKNAAKAWYLKGVIYTSIDTLKTFGKIEQIKVGSSKEAVLGSLGAPSNVNRTTTAGGESEQMVYPDNLYVYVEDDKVTAIQDTDNSLAKLMARNREIKANADRLKKLAPNAYEDAMAAFEESKVADPEQGVFVTGEDGLPVLPQQSNQYFAQSYFNSAVNAYQEEKDYKKSFEYVEKTLKFVPEDTSILLNAGLFFAPSADENEKALEYLKNYQELGGTSTDAYLMQFSIYRDKLKDNDAALKIIKEARAKYPKDPEFPKYELNIYLSEKKYDQAKAMIEKDVQENPDNKEGYYLLGQLNNETGDIDGAKKAFEKAMSIDPQYFDAVAGLTDLYWQEAKKLKDEMGKLGISKEDMAKRVALDKQYVEKLEVYLPYLEKCEKLEPDNVNILYQLLNVYQDLDDKAKIERVKKSLKRLGEEVD